STVNVGCGLCESTGDAPGAIGGRRLAIALRPASMADTSAPSVTTDRARPPRAARSPTSKPPTSTPSAAARQDAGVHSATPANGAGEATPGPTGTSRGRSAVTVDPRSSAAALRLLPDRGARRGGIRGEDRGLLRRRPAG